MNEYGATVAWHLKPNTPFDYESFNRDHEWTLGEGGRAGVGLARLFGQTNRVNPDEAVVAATASCHMLTFLSIAAKRGIKVLSYIDQPSGVVEKNADGRMAITRIVLRPRVVFDETDLDGPALRKLHDSAHRNCFVANSLTADIVVEPA